MVHCTKQTYPTLLAVDATDSLQLRLTVTPVYLMPIIWVFVVFGRDAWSGNAWKLHYSMQKVRATWKFADDSKMPRKLLYRQSITARYFYLQIKNVHSMPQRSCKKASLARNAAMRYAMRARMLLVRKTAVIWSIQRIAHRAQPSVWHRAASRRTAARPINCLSYRHSQSLWSGNRSLVTFRIPNPQSEYIQVTNWIHFNDVSNMHRYISVSTINANLNLLRSINKSYQRASPAISCSGKTFARGSHILLNYQLELA